MIAFHIGMRAPPGVHHEGRSRREIALDHDVGTADCAPLNRHGPNASCFKRLLLIRVPCGVCHQRCTHRASALHQDVGAKTCATRGAGAEKAHCIKVWAMRGMRFQKLACVLRTLLGPRATDPAVQQNVATSPLHGLVLPLHHAAWNQRLFFR